MNGVKENERQGLRLHVSGVVQGVGFRPFVYGLARRYDLTGWVRNSSSGVDIEIDGPAEALAAGLLINVTADKVIRLLPPLILNENEARELVDRSVPLIRDFLAS